MQTSKKNEKKGVYKKKGEMDDGFIYFIKLSVSSSGEHERECTSG